MKNKKILFFLVLALLLVSVIYIYLPSSSPTSLKKRKSEKKVKVEGVLFFMDNTDTLGVIDLEIADNDEERAKGLMGRKNLPANRGMLFVFDREEEQSFWMKNTYLPLDIIFVNSNKDIVKIHHDTQPYVENSLASEDAAQYVIEVNSGYCKEHGVQEGMQVDFVINK